MFVDLICLIQDRPLELARLDEMNQMPTFNTLRISNDMKKVWKASEEFEEGKYVSNKLIFLFIDAHKFLGNQLSPAEIVQAAIEAHSADFDAHMTSVVFEALLHFSKQSAHVPKPAVFLKPCSVHVVRILLALKEVGERHGIKLVFLICLHLENPCTTPVILYTVQVDDFIETNPPVERNERKRKRTLQSNTESALA